MSLAFEDIGQTSGHPGIVVPPHGTYEAMELDPSTIYYHRFVPVLTKTYSNIRFLVEVAAAEDDECDVGVMDADLTKIVSSGATAGLLDGTGTKTVAIGPIELTGGDVYYLGFASGAQGGTAASLTGAYTSASLNTLFGVAAGSVNTCQEDGDIIPAQGAAETTDTANPVLALLY